MALRPARNDDWQAITGQQAPGQWFGIVSDNGWMIEGLGAVYRDIEDRWWLTFYRAPGVRKLKTAHATAKQLIAEALSTGIRLYVLPDPRITGSEVWIARFGFQKTDETREGVAVWTL